MDWTRRDILFGAGLAAGATGAGLARWLGKSAQNAPFRPPGALPEEDFLAACARCGQCVAACPSDTLHLADDWIGPRVGAPTLNPNKTPCTLCHGHDGLQCIAACPTDALQPLTEARQIRIGRAVVDRERCLAFNDVVCRACWHACPFPDEAIRFDGRLRPHVTGRCVGCGLCTRACPTEQTSIPVLTEADAPRGAGHRGRGRGRGD